MVVVVVAVVDESVAVAVAVAAGKTGTVGRTRFYSHRHRSRNPASRCVAGFPCTRQRIHLAGTRCVCSWWTSALFPFPRRTIVSRRAVPHCFLLPA
jgi:hypothetical protein